jgi:hypothetical protein
MNENGCSICKPGEERYNAYFSALAQEWRVHYDYRTPEGVLFSCVTDSVARAKVKRDKWLKEN